MIGVGIVGTGFGGSVHLPGFREVEHAEVVGVASARPKRAREIAAACSLPRCFGTWRELVECPEVDAVSIATPPFLHEEIARTAIECGKSVLCEKPLGMNAEQAGRMLRDAEAAGVVHMVDFEFREIPAWRFMKRLLESREAGSIRHVNVTWIVGSWADPSRLWSWRADSRQGGGTLGALGVHVFDYIEWMFGPIRGLAAQFVTSIPERPDTDGKLRPVDTEDVCHLMLETEDAVPVNVTVSAVAPVGRGHHVDVFGSRKVLVLESDNPTDYGKGFRVREGDAGSSFQRDVPIPADLESSRQFEDGRLAPFISLAQRFVDAVRGEEVEARPSFREGCRARLLMDLAFAANREKRWVNARVPVII